VSVNEILEEFGTKLKEDLQRNLQSKQKEKASRYGSPYNSNSNLVNSIKFVITNTSDSVLFELKMADYFEWVDRGRNPGNVSKEGQKSISDWIRKKGVKVVDIIKDIREKQKIKNPPKTNRTIKRKPKKLTYDMARKQFTYLVARKLQQKGYDGNFFYSEIILDGRLEKLQEDIQQALNEEVQIMIKDFNE
jgi:hypothetical protein